MPILTIEYFIRVSTPVNFNEEKIYEVSWIVQIHRLPVLLNSSPDEV